MRLHKIYHECQTRLTTFGFAHEWNNAHFWLQNKKGKN